MIGLAELPDPGTDAAIDHEEAPCGRFCLAGTSAQIVGEQATNRKPGVFEIGPQLHQGDRFICGPVNNHRAQLAATQFRNSFDTTG